MNRRRFVLLLGTLPFLLGPGLAHAAVARAGTLYKDPSCGCCTEYGRYLGQHGFKLTVVDDADKLEAIRAKYHVPEYLTGCHSLIVEGFVIEGHVPVAAINRLLAEKPPITGIALPGMPMGAPGMAGKKEAPFEILVITDRGDPTLFATE